MVRPDHCPPQLTTLRCARALAGALCAPEPAALLPPRPRTCPNEADAIGCGLMEENTSSTGAPSSDSMMPRATAVSNGATLSCSSASAAA